MKKIKLKYFRIVIWGLVINSLSLNLYSASKISDNADAVLTEVQQLSKRCWQNREKKPELALKLALEAITLAQKHGFKTELAKLYNFAGVINLHYLHKPEPSILYFNDALNLALQTSDSIQIAYVYNNLGDAFYLTGNVVLANEYSGKSLRLFERLNHQLGIAYGLINLGQVDRVNENYVASLDCFFRAIKIRSQIGDSLGFASAHLEVAQTYLAMNKQNDAMKYFRKSWHL